MEAKKLQTFRHSAEQDRCTPPQPSTSSFCFPGEPTGDALVHSATTILSPVPLINRPTSPLSEAVEEGKESSSGPQRTRSAPNSKPNGQNGEKRKRSRVTPEQLLHLERFFAIDRSPTATRRKEVSDLLGMQERQTQIWFQNRRAKAKLVDGKQKGRGGGAEMPPDTPPELSTGFQIDLHNLIHEDEPVTIIPCTDLSIGTWRRIATTVGRHDLVAYFCDRKQCLTWFIHSAGCGFKMEIAFDTIIETEFHNQAPGSGLAVFILSRPPAFFLEHVVSGTSGVPIRTWKRCTDWTEGLQATTILRHELIGSAVQLAHVLGNLQTNSSGAEIILHSPSYQSLSLPPTPLSDVDISEYPCVDSDEERNQNYDGPSLSNSLPTLLYNDVDSRPSSLSAPTSNFTSSYTTVSDRGSPAASTFGGSLYGEYSRNSFGQTQHLDGYPGVPISHGLANRSYESQPIPRTFYGEAPNLGHQYNPHDLRRPSLSPSLSNLATNISPPPLLTNPFHPHTDNGLQHGRSHHLGPPQVW